MIRRLCMLVAVVLAVASAFVAPDADAQGAPTCPLFLAQEPIGDPPPPTPESTVVPSDDMVTGSDTALPAAQCADAQAYPGPFANMPTTPAGPYAAPIGIRATAEAPSLAASPASDRGLAHSGSETYVLAYLGTGLLAFGAVALGMRRSSKIE